MDGGIEYFCIKTYSCLNDFFFFFERQIWITDGLLEYHRATSRTTRSYPSPLGIMPIHQFRRKPNKYGKNPIVGIEHKTYWSQSLIPLPKCHYAIKQWTK
ncbi:hypothetical protein Hanom_Chr08g00689221 [Helianthus anomalus]